MRYTEVRSAKNPLFRELYQLRKGGPKKGAFFFLEGPRACAEILSLLEERRLVPQALLLDEEAPIERYPFDLSSYVSRLRKLGEIKTYRLASHLFARLAGTEHSQGVLLLLRRADFPLLADYEQRCLLTAADVSSPLDLFFMVEAGETVKPGLYLYFEKIQDPGNLGTILRMAKAFALNALFFGPGSAAVLQEKVLRASLSAALSLPLAEQVPLAALTRYKERGLRLFTLDMEGSSLTEFVRRHPSYRDEAILLILGNEARGLSDDARAAAEGALSIPMPGGAESLNLAVAASVASYCLHIA